MGEGWEGGEIPPIPSDPVAQAFQPVQVYLEYETSKAAAYEKSQAAGLSPGWLPAFRFSTPNQWPGNPAPAPMLNQ